VGLGQEALVESDFLGAGYPAVAVLDVDRAEQRFCHGGLLVKVRRNYETTGREQPKEAYRQVEC